MAWLTHLNGHANINFNIYILFIGERKFRLPRRVARAATKTYGRLRRLHVVSEIPSSRGRNRSTAEQRILQQGGSVRGGSLVKPSPPKSAVSSKTFIKS